MRALVAFALGGWITGCIDREPKAQYCQSPAPTMTTPTATPTYHADVAPILAAHCVRCHQDGGNGPFPLDTYAAVAPMAPAISGAVTTRHMPPWPPAPCCAEFVRDRALSDTEISLLADWANIGTPEGPDAGPPPTVTVSTLDRVDVTLSMSQPYTPAPQGTIDENRCFLIDWPGTQDEYVTGIDIQPADRQEVHHAVALVAGPDDLPFLNGLDGKDGRPGWNCPGGLVGAFRDFIGGTFFEAETFPEGTGHLIHPGDKVVLNMHYLTPTTGAFGPDQTTLLIREQTEPVTPLVAVLVVNPAWMVGAMPIPAGNPNVVFDYLDDPTLTFGGQTVQLRAVNLHMHERGSSGQVAILHADGTRECLLQIDDWSHGWQGEYYFTAPKPLVLGDQVLLECHFDNSAGHQRIVNGVMEKPRDLNWGTDQEMCEAFLIATVGG